MDSFGFAVLNDQRELLLLRQYDTSGSGLEPSFLEEACKADQHLSAAYRNTRLAYSLGEQVLVPDRLYDPKERATYLQFSTRLPEKTEVLTDTISAFGIKLVYAAPTATDEAVRRLFPGARVFYLGSALMEGQRKMVDSGTGQSLLLHLKDQWVFVSAVEEGHLAFFNAYAYRSAKDFLYYALLACEQSGFKPEQVPVYLSGQLMADSEIYRLLARYFKKQQFLDPGALFSLAPELGKADPYLYFDLLSLSLL